MHLKKQLRFSYKVKLSIDARGSVNGQTPFSSTCIYRGPNEVSTFIASNLFEKTYFLLEVNYEIDSIRLYYKVSDIICFVKNVYARNNAFPSC